MSGENPLDHGIDAIYRIGAEVRDHASRIRMLEHDLSVLSEGNLMINRSIEAFHTETKQSIKTLTEKFEEHVWQEDGDRAKLMASNAKLVASNIGQVVALVIAVLLVIWERAV